MANLNLIVILLIGLTTLDVDHTLYLGGLETFESFYPDPENIDPHFQGCMRNLQLNGKSYPLTPDSGWRGLSILDCDGTACGGEVCDIYCVLLN